MIRSRLPLYVGFFLAAGFGTLFVNQSFASESGPGSISKSENLLKQKIFLLERIVLHSASSRKMKESGSAQVLSLMEQAEEKLVAAKLDLDNNRPIEGSKQADEALKLMTSASTISAQAKRSTMLQRSRHEELMSGIRALEPPGANSYSPEVQRLMKSAETSVKEDDYKTANYTLAKALEILATNVGSGYDDTTLVYALKFDTPHEEFRYEESKYQSNIILIKMMLENNPTRTSEDLARRVVAEARSGKEEADRLFQKDDLDAAISQLEATNKKLSTSLSYLGANVQ
jgi:hypothetical protein